jgi:hypothetical protein
MEARIAVCGLFQPDSHTPGVGRLERRRGRLKRQPGRVGDDG